MTIFTRISSKKCFQKTLYAKYALDTSRYSFHFDIRASHTASIFFLEMRTFANRKTKFADSSIVRVKISRFHPAGDGVSLQQHLLSSHR